MFLPTFSCKKNNLPRKALAENLETVRTCCFNIYIYITDKTCVCVYVCVLFGHGMMASTLRFIMSVRSVPKRQKEAKKSAMLSLHPADTKLRTHLFRHCQNMLRRKFVRLSAFTRTDQRSRMLRIYGRSAVLSVA